MEIVFSNQVQDKIDEYASSLTEYPISEERICEKVEMLKTALLSLGSSISTPHLCNKKDLGQILSSNGEPLNKNLKRKNYGDKSQYQWAFSCHYDYDNDVITIVKMMPSSEVKESVYKANNTITESHIRQIVRRTLIRLLQL